MITFPQGAFIGYIFNHNDRECVYCVWSVGGLELGVVVNKSRIAPEPRVVGGGLRTGCSGYQERVAQN